MTITATNATDFTTFNGEQNLIFHYELFLTQCLVKNFKAFSLLKFECSLFFLDPTKHLDNLLVTFSAKFTFGCSLIVRLYAFSK